MGQPTNGSSDHEIDLGGSSDLQFEQIDTGNPDRVEYDLSTQTGS